MFDKLIFHVHWNLLGCLSGFHMICCNGFHFLPHFRCWCFANSFWNFVGVVSMAMGYGPGLETFIVESQKWTLQLVPHFWPAKESTGRDCTFDQIRHLWWATSATQWETWQISAEWFFEGGRGAFLKAMERWMRSLVVSLVSLSFFSPRNLQKNDLIRL